MKKTNILKLGFAALLANMTVSHAKAQTISFDTDDYKAVGVYDSWEQSPFRTGRLDANAAVIDNHLNQVNDILGYAPNATKKIAGVQMSHYAGNLFGLRVDLKEPFRLTKKERYVHVMINRPVDEGRCMLITLGKRSERAGQSQEVEQTWSLSSTSVGKDGWYDAVFAIKGFSYEEKEKNGIDIYSLVVCPDITDRSTRDDYICYIDEIVIDDKPAARFSTENYATNFEKTAKTTRTDRRLNSVGISGGSDGAQSVSGLGSFFYEDRTSVIFNAKAGETLKPTFNYTGTWMDGYVYVDWGNDGSFNTSLQSNGKPAEGSDVVSYNAYMPADTWYKSDGTTVANGNQIQNGVPTFKVPSATANGFYRMRYKVDWNSIDPGGNTEPGNLFTNNGGGIVDVLLNIHGKEVSVTASQLNGDIYAAGNMDKPLQDFKVAYGQPLTIKVVPAPGFTYSGIRVRYGYHLNGDSLVHDNPQYFDRFYRYSEFKNDEITLPADILCTDKVEIEGYMIDEKFLELREDATTDDKKKSVGLGKKLATDDADAEVYIDYNRDGKFSLVTEDATEGVDNDVEPGFYRAVIVSGAQQKLLTVNVYPELSSLKVDSRHGRIIGRQTWTSTTQTSASTSTGVPVEVVAFKFCGLVAQPLLDGYECRTATVRHGYNLDGERWSTDGIEQWSEYTIEIAQDGTSKGRINLAKDSVYGDIKVTAIFEMSDKARFLPVCIDEFDGEEIDKALWQTSPKASSAWNRFISDDPRVAYLEDGSLVCRAISDGAGGMLTGAKQTSKHFSFNHGYVEVRAKTRQHTGNFPAIWMMPDNTTGGWPKCGEIDIWETINTENTAYHTIHYYSDGNKSRGGNKPYTMEGEWHTYGLLKEAKKLTWYIDGTEVFTAVPDNLANKEWPYDKKFYIILNQSVGNGSWANNPDTSFTYETRFDWCRVYQLAEDLKEDGNTAILPTGIVDMESDSNGSASDRNERGGIYTIDGIRHGRMPAHGIVIVNGRKVIR